MSVIALSLPETIILRKVLSVKLITVFVGVVGAVILTVGFLSNALFNWRSAGNARPSQYQGHLQGGRTLPLTAVGLRFVAPPSHRSPPRADAESAAYRCAHADDNDAGACGNEYQRGAVSAARDSGGKAPVTSWIKRAAILRLTEPTLQQP